MWIDYDLGLDTPYTTSDIIGTACAPPAPNDYSPPVFKQLLMNIAGEQTGVSAKRLGWWLRKISGRIVDGYRLVRKQARSNRASFWLQKVA